MSEGPANLVARHVHDLIERQRLDALPDHALLRRFLEGNEGAFAALVRRHGPLVLGTCRRILRHAQDAEDACQAVFLVLARKGRMVRGELLAGWLHRVAVRAASRLRRQLARQSTEPLPSEPQVPAPTDDELVWREVRQTIDTEVGRLPDRLRVPVVLCCLQGKTRSEAAAELGWTEGTVRGRLERGRKLLRSRFTRKGLTLPATLVALLAEQVAPATTPADLVSPSAAAARLADGVVRSMALARAKLAAWATAAVLVVATAVGVGVYRPVTAQPKTGDAPPAASETPRPTAAHAGRNLDTFTLRVSLAPAGEGKTDPKYSLYHVLLYVPNLRLEPPANGPDGNPVEAHARITREQARKIVDALGGFDFFKDDSAFGDPQTAKLQLMHARTWPHVGIAVRFQNGEDASRLERRLAWLPSMFPPLDAVRGCVDGDAARALDRFLAQLSEDRKRWAPDPLTEDLRKLQGAWAIDPREFLNRDGLTGVTAKCVVDGKSITLKPQVQLDPLLDLETIRGTFELTAGTPRTMIIKGVRETVAKQEAGTWTALYEVSDTTLRLLLPPAGAAAPAGWKPAKDKGEREFTLKRVAAGLMSEWGEASNHLQARIRTPKVRYAAGETPTFDLDVRDRHAGIAGKPWHWLAPRVGQIARVEIDGVWYRAPEIAFKKLAAHPLRFGESVESWATVHLTDDYWVREGDEERGGRRLVLKPGKHRVRVSYDFTANEGGHTARPVSGAIELEITPSAGRAPRPATDWTSRWALSPHGPGGVQFLGVAGDHHLYTAGKDGVILWDVSGPEPKVEQKVSYTTQGLSVAGLDRDRHPLLVRRLDMPRLRGAQAELTVLRLPDMDRNLPPTVTVDSDRFRTTAVSPDQKRLAVVAGDLAWTRLIDVESGKDRALQAPTAPDRGLPYPHALLFSRDGKTLIGLGSNDYPVRGKVNGVVICWDTETGKIRWRADEGAGHSVGALSPDGRTLVTGGSLVDPEVIVWDVETGNKRARRTVLASALAVSPDRSTVLIGTLTDDAPRKGLLWVWDLARNETLAQSIQVPAPIRAISFADDGSGFATADSAGEVRWWVK